MRFGCCIVGFNGSVEPVLLLLSEEAIHIAHKSIDMHIAYMQLHK